MKNIAKIFKNNKKSIKEHLYQGIDKIDTDVKLDALNLQHFFPIFDSLELIYAVDKTYNQISPVFSKDKIDNDQIGKQKESLFENITFDENGYYMSTPYISAQNGKHTLTVAKRINDDNVIALDFSLVQLLEDMKLVSKVKFFHHMTTTIYATIGYSLALFSLILVFYALYSFIDHMISEDVALFNAIFKSTIALTLGLAIFDLSKNLLEHEVVYKEHLSQEHGSSRLLIKFLISIIIALSIEALMTVFKITLSNYKEMHYAVYLILAVSVLIVSVSFFDKKHSKDEI